MAEISAGHSTHTTVGRLVARRAQARDHLAGSSSIVAAAARVAFIVNNMIVNLRTLGIPLGFDFLDSTAGFADQLLD